MNQELFSTLMAGIQWDHENAAKSLDHIITILGTPSVFSNLKGGIAIWNKDVLNQKKFYGLSNCYHEVILRDENIEHYCPARHYDFLYTYIEVPVDPHQFKMIGSVSGSVAYDPLKNLISARCGSLEANIATLKLITDLLLENNVDMPNYGIKYSNLEEARSNNAYKKQIMMTSSDDAVKMLYKALKRNIEKLNSEKKLNKGFWKGAFSRLGDECLPPDKADKITGTNGINGENSVGGRQLFEPQFIQNKSDKEDKLIDDSSYNKSYKEDKLDKNLDKKDKEGKKDKEDKEDKLIGGTKPIKKSHKSGDSDDEYYYRYMKYKSKYKELKEDLNM
jgi:hypothetical protein